MQMLLYSVEEYDKDVLLQNKLLEMACIFRKTNITSYSYQLRPLNGGMGSLVPRIVVVFVNRDLIGFRLKINSSNLVLLILLFVPKVTSQVEFDKV